MAKAKKISYWIATLWLALGMTSTGIVQIIKQKESTDFIINMGYPEYFLTLLGMAKLLGVVAVLIPRFPLLKEWAYAGFVFMMSGAVYSHIASGSAVADMFGASLLLILTLVSYFLRPENRRVVQHNVHPI